MLVALCPDLIVSSGFEPLQMVLTHDLHTSRLTLELGSSLSDAGYALGAVVAVDLVQRFAQRRLFVYSQMAVVVGAAISAVAQSGWTYGTGRMIDGLATGFLLVLALPPLVTTFGAGRLPFTMALVNIGLFGAAAAGPLVAGGVAATGAWRQLYAAVAVLSALGVLLTWRTLPERDGLNPNQAINPTLFPLAVASTVLPFFGAAQLTSHSFRSVLVWVPLAVGIIALGLLVVTQYRHSSPLIPVRRLNSTLPLAGTICAMIGGAAFVLCLQVVQIWMTDVVHRQALDGAVMLWPAVVGAVVAAAIFGRVLRTRLLAAVVGAGLVCLLGAAALLQLLKASGGQETLIMVIALLLGLGAGMTVAPGLFTAALSLPSSEVARAVGVVELLRAEAAFVLAPMVAHVAMWHGSRPAEVLAGLRDGSWTALVIAGAGLVGLGALLASGWVAPQRPDLDAWLDGDSPALASPPVGAVVRSSA
ncbi:MAG: MFS transporter [Actinomycetota bacterium]|nr:MFS transporter [Actinomycetota bacterium]